MPRLPTMVDKGSGRRAADMLRQMEMLLEKGRSLICQMLICTVVAHRLTPRLAHHSLFAPSSLSRLRSTTFRSGWPWQNSRRFSAMSAA
jgi:hypothetical protein